MSDLIAEEEFVWPWMGVLANLKTEHKDGRRVGESGSKLKNEFAKKGFNPLRVNPLWSSHQGHSGFAVVEFDKDWKGFHNAMCFEKSFKNELCGKKEYEEMRGLGEKIYGWVARADDYNGRSLVGDFLRRNGDLKTIFGQQEEEERRTEKLVSILSDTLEIKKSDLQEMKSKYEEISECINKLLHENDVMVKAYNEARQSEEQNARNFLKQIFSDHERIAAQLEAQKKELEEREKQLQQLRAHNNSERRIIYHEQQRNEGATLLQSKADQNLLRLAEEQMREKKKLNKKIIELQKQLDSKQSLELEIERMRGALNVMRHMDDQDEDLESKKKKMDEIQDKLREKEEELTDVKELYRALVVKERRNNDEVQEARKELISGLCESNNRASIGVKKVADLDHKLFLKATKKKYTEEEADEKAKELCALWDSYLRAPGWHPFKNITDKEGNTKAIIDEQDEKLKDLKSELGDDVYTAMMTALMELNGYNASGCYTVSELWNYKEGRKASLREGVLFMLGKWKQLKRRRRN